MSSPSPPSASHLRRQKLVKLLQHQGVVSSTTAFVDEFIVNVAVSRIAAPTVAGAKVSTSASSSFDAGVGSPAGRRRVSDSPNQQRTQQKTLEDEIDMRLGSYLISLDEYRAQQQHEAASSQSMKGLPHEQQLASEFQPHQMRHGTTGIRAMPQSDFPSFPRSDADDSVRKGRGGRETEQKYARATLLLMQDGVVLVTDRSPTNKNDGSSSTSTAAAHYPWEKPDLRARHIPFTSIVSATGTATCPADPLVITAAARRSGEYEAGSIRDGHQIKLVATATSSNPSNSIYFFLHLHWGSLGSTFQVAISNFIAQQRREHERLHSGELFFDGSSPSRHQPQFMLKTSSGRYQRAMPSSPSRRRADVPPFAPNYDHDAIRQLARFPTEHVELTTHCGLHTILTIQSTTSAAAPAPPAQQMAAKAARDFTGVEMMKAKINAAAFRVSANAGGLSNLQSKVSFQLPSTATPPARRNHAATHFALCLVYVTQNLLCVIEAVPKQTVAALEASRGRTNRAEKLQNGGLELVNHPMSQVVLDMSGVLSVYVFRYPTSQLAEPEYRSVNRLRDAAITAASASASTTTAAAASSAHHRHHAHHHQQDVDGRYPIFADVYELKILYVSPDKSIEELTCLIPATAPNVTSNLAAVEDAWLQYAAAVACVDPPLEELRAAFRMYRALDSRKLGYIPRSSFVSALKLGVGSLGVASAVYNAMLATVINSRATGKIGEEFARLALEPKSAGGEGNPATSSTPQGFFDFEDADDDESNARLRENQLLLGFTVFLKCINVLLVGTQRQRAEFLFNAIDTGNYGAISHQHLFAFVRRLTNKGDVQQMWESFPSHGQEWVPLREFIECACAPQSLVHQKLKALKLMHDGDENDKVAAGAAGNEEDATKSDATSSLLSEILMNNFLDRSDRSQNSSSNWGRHVFPGHELWPLTVQIMIGMSIVANNGSVAVARRNAAAAASSPQQQRTNPLSSTTLQSLPTPIVRVIPGSSSSTRHYLHQTTYSLTSGKLLNECYDDVFRVKLTDSNWIVEFAPEVFQEIREMYNVSYGTLMSAAGIPEFTAGLCSGAFKGLRTIDNEYVSEQEQRGGGCFPSCTSARHARYGLVNSFCGTSFDTRNEQVELHVIDEATLSLHLRTLSYYHSHVAVHKHSSLFPRIIGLFAFSFDAQLRMVMEGMTSAEADLLMAASPTSSSSQEEKQPTVFFLAVTLAQLPTAHAKSKVLARVRVGGTLQYDAQQPQQQQQNPPTTVRQLVERKFGSSLRLEVPNEVRNDFIDRLRRDVHYLAEIAVVHGYCVEFSLVPAKEYETELRRKANAQHQQQRQQEGLFSSRVGDENEQQEDLRMVVLADTEHQQQTQQHHRGSSPSRIGEDDFTNYQSSRWLAQHQQQGVFHQQQQQEESGRFVWVCPVCGAQNRKVPAGGNRLKPCAVCFSNAPQDQQQHLTHHHIHQSVDNFLRLAGAIDLVDPLHSGASVLRTPWTAVLGAVVKKEKQQQDNVLLLCVASLVDVGNEVKLSVQKGTGMSHHEVSSLCVARAKEYAKTFFVNVLEVLGDDFL